MRARWSHTVKNFLSGQLSKVVMASDLGLELQARKCEPGQITTGEMEMAKMNGPQQIILATQQSKTI